MQASVPQNDSRHPLTRLLGNGGNIRVLRALAADDLPLSVTQLAERCGLTPQGTRLALEPAAGDDAGDGRSLSVWLVQAESPVEPLVAACQERYAALEHSAWTACAFRGLSLADLQALSADPLWWRANTAQARVLKGLDPSVLVLRSRKPAQAALFGA